MLRKIVFLLIALLLGSCFTLSISSAGNAWASWGYDYDEDDDDDLCPEEAIRERNQQFMDSWAAGDPAGVAAIYAEDAIFLFPNNEPFVGRAAIEGFLGYAIYVLNIAENILTTDEIEHRGSIAWELGRYELWVDGVLFPVDYGPYIVIWHKIDGVWYIYRDILNSSMPLPAP